MTLRWFTRKGIVFLPASLPGWLIALGTAVWLVLTFLDVDSRSHSVSDTLMNFGFNALIIAVLYSIVGFVSSARE